MFDDVPPSTTSPVPPSACTPGLKRRSVVEPVLAIVSTALSVKPLTTLRSWPLSIVMSPLSVTPLNVPPLVVVRNDEPSANATVPPTTVPPRRRHDPVAAFSVRFVFVNTPVRFTVPPVRVITPMPACVNVPPRFKVELVTFTAPRLFQAPANVSVEFVADIIPVPALVQVVPAIDRIPPLIASAVPLLVNPLVPIVSVWPEMSADRVPSLTTELAELWLILPRPWTSMSAPIVSVVAPPKPSSRRLFDDVPPSSTSPVPPSACTPGLKRRSVVEPVLASVSTALSVKPLTTSRN